MVADLETALTALGQCDGVDLAGFAFEPVDGGSQSRVWRGWSADGTRDVAVRISARSGEQLTRLGRLKASLTTVATPRTLAVAELPDGSASAELTSWLESAEQLPADWSELGRVLGRLHEQMRASPVSVEDRPFSMSESARPRADTSWEQAIVRHAPAIHAWQELRRATTGTQTIHGDVHPGNLLRIEAGYAVLDFDKVMHGPRVFDLAKAIATTCFGLDRATGSTSFQVETAARMIDGYRQTATLSRNDRVAVVGACLLVNRSTAELGHQFGNPVAVDLAGAIGRWWLEQPIGVTFDRGPGTMNSGTR